MEFRAIGEEDFDRQYGDLEEGDILKSVQLRSGEVIVSLQPYYQSVAAYDAKTEDQCIYVVDLCWAGQPILNWVTPSMDLESTNELYNFVVGKFTKLKAL